MIGAVTMMSNGALLGKIGTSIICCVANTYKKPVIVCCETYKFSEKVQLDSICSNELGSPDIIAYNTIFTENKVQFHIYYNRMKVQES